MSFAAGVVVASSAGLWLRAHCAAGKGEVLLLLARPTRRLYLPMAAVKKSVSQKPAGGDSSLTCVWARSRPCTLRRKATALMLHTMRVRYLRYHASPWSVDSKKNER